MEKFQPGSTYKHRWICDASLISEIQVTRRTDKTVFFIDPDSHEEKKAKIHRSEDSEFFYPCGKYSMCPVLRAKNKI
jgi:hypothetical protein